MQGLLNSINSIEIKSLSDPSFAAYGRVVTGYDWGELVEYMESKTAIPEQGNCYLAGDAVMEAMPVAKQLQERFYASFPLQIGYCNGRNSKLNALEYHKGSEIDIAITPMVLLLAPLQAVRDGRLDTDRVEAFYLPTGAVVELYGTTLHFSPCKVSEDGFKCVVILPKGTNLPLESKPEAAEGEDKLLWMTNKWLLAHSESVPASKGAWVGLDGTNIEILYK